MRQVTAERTIGAPREAVFDVTAHIENYAEVVPTITAARYLGQQRTGVGTRFRETRANGRRSASTVLEVTEYRPPDHVRFVSDAGGTIWDTEYRYTSTDAGTELQLVMDIKPYRLLARLTTPFVQRSVARAVEADLDAVKRHCEGR